MDTPPPLPKKGLGVLGWLGSGCGGIVVLVIIACIIAYPMKKSAGKKFTAMATELNALGAEIQTNPTHAMVSSMMLTGQFEIVKEDPENQRYTIKKKATGTLMTIYWDEAQKKPLTIPGDFSAIPSDTEEKAVGEKEEKK